MRRRRIDSARPPLRQLLRAIRHVMREPYEAPPGEVELERLTRTMVLADGRTLAYSDLGHPAGLPVLVAHGIPSCRFDGYGLHHRAASMGLRILTPDRPGWGRSSPAPRLSHLGWAEDVSQLLDHLGVDRLGVIGFSGGAGHALGLAHALPERVSAVVLVSGAIPWDATTAHLATRSQRFFASWRSAPLRALARKLERLARAVAPDPLDLEIRGRTGIEWMVVTGIEGCRQNMSINIDEPQLLRRWEFSPAEIGQPVAIWHGAEDREASVDLARWLAGELRVPTLRVVHGGHQAPGRREKDWVAWLLPHLRQAPARRNGFAFSATGPPGARLVFGTSTPNSSLLRKPNGTVSATFGPPTVTGSPR